MGLLKKIFGSTNERTVKKLSPIVDEINQHTEALQGLSEEALIAKTPEFKERLANGETLDDLLPEAFAVVKEACRRMLGKTIMVTGKEMTWDMVPYDVQLIGGLVLHQGRIAEMATGEGKTLVATLPLYLNALEGKGAHLVTVNDYLAQRDSEWMGEIFRYLGLTVGVILNNMDSKSRREAYNCDITYGTNNEFGFDYLRDNMSVSPEDIVQVRGHHYAIVDEVDSVLIDEARTPLIISGPVEQSFNAYGDVKPMVERLVKLQTKYVNSLIAEAEQDLEAGKEEDAGLKLLIAQRGAPKNRRLSKLFQRQGIKKLVFDIESAFLRDKKMHEVDEELYYAIEEKRNSINLTDKGRAELSPNDPNEFILPDLAEEFSRIEGDTSLSPQERSHTKNEFQMEYAAKSEKLHSISQLLKAYSLFEKDVEYVVENGKVLIVDEFTGRTMYGRRFSDGLHQALEAKENVKIEGETQTLATITLQNYFRLYDKLAGMTGTAETEAKEFWDIYKLDVVVIPTNKPVRRVDAEDMIYRTLREKYNAVIEEIEHLHKLGRPVLVGTVSVEVSETLSRMLKRRRIPHSVLNAKYHKQESEIISQAGQPGSVTIATNMAGRGTDIKLGKGVRGEGTDGFGEDGTPYGLQIIGTSRHEARRIDRQLRGRSGRQGDPGFSRFYLSLEDELMRLFGSDRLIKVMDRLGAEEGEVITHSMVTKAIEKAQKRVEEQNYSIRKHLLEYDDVMNKQRDGIYTRRRKALMGQTTREDLVAMLEDFLDVQFTTFIDSKKSDDEWDLEGLSDVVLRTLMIDIHALGDKLYQTAPDDLYDYIKEEALKMYDYKTEKVGETLQKEIERWWSLRIIDDNWKDHLHMMDMLKEGINLRAYGQKDPLIEYKREAFEMFQDLIDRVNQQTLEKLWTTELVQVPSQHKGGPSRLMLVHRDATNMGLSGQGQGGETAIQKAARESREQKKTIKVDTKVGRNDPCPCGSGKKYKKCHGAGVA
ncbi:MAG: preprotein translocase subunit SecA [Calditrichaeota bacterium]|nr:preprotein translocase subunit SecA [Calditrichota bacterium]